VLQKETEEGRMGLARNIEGREEETKRRNKNKMKKRNQRK
jgi:hypothetical protein